MSSGTATLSPTGAPARPTALIRASRGLFQIDFQALWQFRELLYFFVWRDLKVRYKQTAIGAAWALLQPLMTMVIFSVVFGRFAKIPSDGFPYPIFAYAALLPWYYFAQAVNNCAVSLVGDAGLVRKVYFPRLILPLAAVLRPIVDMLLSLLILLGMMVWFGIVPTWRLFLLPLFLLQATLTALGAGLWLTALNVRYRDVGYTIPFLVQAWMFASPVVYSLNLVPAEWRLLYSLNPMVGVIEGFRWALLGTASPAMGPIFMSLGAVLSLVFGGILFFNRMERSFADVI
jgi:lipopolysaccharide transport system permease protein